jgi:hypothetical protein
MSNQSATASITKAELAQSILQFKGKPYRLTGYEPFIDIYNSDTPLIVIQAGRQVSKSVTVGGLIITNAIAEAFATSIYISPLSQQASRFSTMYLVPFMNSPLIRKRYMDSDSKKNVFEKSFNNGSIIFLSYAQNENDADRVRGIAASKLFVDEIQDVEFDALSIIGETLSAAEEPRRFYTGTAKGEDNTLERFRKLTNQLEWGIKCPHCGTWSIPYNEENCVKMTTLNPEGPGCVKCGKLLDVSKGKWVAAAPSVKDKFGFHVPQLIVPERVKPSKFGEIREKLELYPRPKWLNEVAGLAAGRGNRILSMSEAIACCDSTRTKFDDCWPRDSRGIVNVVLGVDWSVTGSIISYTVASVIGYDYMGKAYLLYSERMQGTDILEQVTRVEQIYRQFNCQMMGSDRGVGVLQGQLLQGTLSPDQVHMIQYVAAKMYARYDPQGGYLSVDRTQAMDSVILRMKLGKLKFNTPRWEMTQQYWKDALAVFEEESLSGRRLYRKDEGAVDDWLHSIVFGHVAWQLLTGQISYIDHASNP